MHIKNESLKQYTERIKVIFQRCQHKCEVSLFTKHPTNVVGVALQAHKEDKSKTPRGSSTITSKGKAGTNSGQDRFIALCLSCTVTLPQSTGMWPAGECKHRIRGVHSTPLREKLLLLLFTSPFALSTLSQLEANENRLSNVPLGQQPASAEHTALVSGGSAPLLMTSRAVGRDSVPWHCPLVLCAPTESWQWNRLPDRR